MIDPFLLAHQVAPLSFEIGGVLSPVSIRDQMIRGRWIIDRLLEAGLIASGQKLLIIGAGAAGATAAIEGAAQGIRVTLIDTAPAPFLRQAGCSSRWVDPTQYDWPVDHWTNSRFPWTSPPMPLGWIAGRANMLAMSWWLALTAARLNDPAALDLRFNTGLAGFPNLISRKGSDELEASFTSSASKEYFKIAVSTVGFGTEKTSLGTFSSYRFWDTDPLERSDYGLQPKKSQRILISGGGDGSLQDFIRVSTTAHSARQVYDALPLMPALRAALESAIQSAEDQAERAYLWGTPGNLSSPARDHAIHERLHQAFVSQVDVIAGYPVIWPRVMAALSKIVRPSGTADIVLVYPCGHFDRCYALNRFLVLLLAKFYQVTRGTRVLYPNVKVSGVTGVTHGCANDPAACYGKTHDVSFNASACYGFPSPASMTYPGSDHEIVLLRHGITPPASVYRPLAVSIQFPRQIMPYYSPW
jgi:FAD dependent oxidoreductase